MVIKEELALWKGGGGGAFYRENVGLSLSYALKTDKCIPSTTASSAWTNLKKKKASSS
jgi:hypothetical protein